MAADDEMTPLIEVYTDGSFIMENGKGRAGYGIHWPENEATDISAPFTLKNPTNQRAELYAIYKAMKLAENVSVETENGENTKGWLDAGCLLHIYTDSEYSIKSLTLWIGNWKMNGWKTSTGKPVKNLDIIKPTDRLLQAYKGQIEFHHVRSHTGRKDRHSLGNEQADALATAGARKHN